MKLFGDLPPPSWFASEVLRLLVVVPQSTPSAESESEEDKRALQTFILNQAAKFSLSTRDLQEDLQRSGVPMNVAQQIASEYESQRETLRANLLKPDSFPSIHARIVNIQYTSQDRFNLSLAGNKEPIALTINEPNRIALADALDKAVQAFDDLS